MVVLTSICSSVIGKLFSHPTWIPNNEEERRFIEKVDNVEWDFESTEVDIQLSVVQRNVISLIDDMKELVRPKLVSELVDWAMKVDNYRRPYRMWLEERNDTSAPDFGRQQIIMNLQQITKLGYTAEDIIFAHMRNIKQQGHVTLLLSHCCPFMRLTP
ncbi:hypothetical protein FNV43_RR08098 [Rhamnella rubrinervis]|uniref:Uncharacterized protein n=1 Tax=Rhamnella rubrinervis TaxID=2594499 RepID=A0A8K0MMY7_9ROSA|nr:hypothetical protein FNV43_RR08098 [Rhamnella rubrinervis]